jgi:hypothetical protein
MAMLRWMRELFERIAPPLGGVLPWVGVVLLAVAAGFAVRSWMFARGGVKAVATVTENVSRFAKEGGVLYVPRVRFRAANGKLVTEEVGQGSDEIEFAAGETVPVLYRADDPQGAVIATVWRMYYWSIVMGIGGTVVFDLGWVLRVLIRRPMRMRVEG